MCTKSTSQSKTVSTGVLSRARGGRGALWRETASRTVIDYTAGFKSETVRKILTRLAPERYSAYTLLNMLGARMSGCAGYPLGGADGVITRMTQKFEALGGKLIFGLKAEELIIADNKAKGIRAGGIAYTADGVIAACGVPYVLDCLLGNRFRHPQLHRLLRSGPLFEPLAAVSFGLCKRFDIPYAMTCECPEGLSVAQGVRRHGFALRSFDFDPGAAPDGCSSVMAMFEAPLEYWKSLREKSPESYRLQKELLADHIAAKIEMRYPGFRDAIELVDVATPATFVRLTNAYRGSLEGFAPTPEIIKTPIRKTVAGLGRFCLCGQWTSPGGGIAAAIAGGREAAQLIKKEIRRPGFSRSPAVLPEKEWTSPA